MKKKPIVLVVDDDPLARELLCERLGESEYQLMEAGSGPEAIEMARKVPPDLILLDVMMPQVDGFETCRRLREHPVSREIPILMITALDDHPSKIKGLEAGADDFISKSYDPTELKARVRTIARLNRYRRLITERAKFEWVVEQSDHGYLLLDGSDAVIYANPKARQLLDYSAGEKIEGTFLGIATQKFRCEPRDAWADWPQTPAGVPLFLLRPESKASGALWLGVDQLAAPANERLVKLSDETFRMGLGRNLWQFSSLVSDKLDAPLTMTLGSLDMLADDIERYSKAEVQRVAELARRSGQRLGEQIRNIVTLLAEPDRSPWDEGGLDLAALEPMVADLAPSLGLPFATVSLAADARGRLPLSPVAAELILREIFANAKSFHPSANPSITIQVDVTGTGPTAGKPGHRQVRLRVRSDRSSVSADQATRSWVPYYRHRTAGDAGSQGFGSSMVGYLVWGLGGSCRLEDDEGGMVAEVVLPLLPGQPARRASGL